MYRKMTLVPTRAGYVYECCYCKTRMATDEADSHNCEEQLTKPLRGRMPLDDPCQVYDTYDLPQKMSDPYAIIQHNETGAVCECSSLMS